MAVLKPKQWTPECVQDAQELFEKKTSKTVKPARPLQCPPDINYMEALLSNAEHVEALEELRPMVTNDMFKLLTILYQGLEQKSEETIEAVLSYIFHAKQFSLAEISFAEIAALKFGKNDVIWYLWRVLLLYANALHDEIMQSVCIQSMWILF